MLAVIIKGILLGLSIALFFGFGPSFFAVFQTALYKGTLRGILMALGVFLSDALMVALSLWGAHSIIENSEKYEVLGLVGGAILIVFGIVIFKTKTLRTEKDEKLDVDVKSPHPIVCTVKGFFLNVANPFIWIFWAGVVLGVSGPLKANIFSMLTFLTSALLTIFSIDIIKVKIANKIKPLINDRFLMGLNKAAGIILIVFGITLLIRTVIEYSGVG